MQNPVCLSKHEGTAKRNHSLQGNINWSTIVLQEIFPEICIRFLMQGNPSERKRNPLIYVPQDNCWDLTPVCRTQAQSDPVTWFKKKRLIECDGIIN